MCFIIKEGEALNLMDIMKIKKYINNKEYLIYKKSLSYKNGIGRVTYYLIINNNEIIDILAEREIGNSILPERLSIKNIELFVYKVVEKEGDRYYSFRKSKRIEYKLNEVITTDDLIGMFFCKDIKSLEEHFFMCRNRIKMKMMTTIDDLIGGSERVLQFRKCIPIEII